MKTYQVTTYDDRATYRVSLDNKGVVRVDGLLPSGAETLKFAVERHITAHGLTPVAALGKAVGAYSYITEVENDTL